MTASEAEIMLVEVDVGDSPTFSVVVDPFDVTTTMTATLTDPGGVATPFTMVPNGDRSVWTGTTAALPAPGEYTAKFTIIGTGAGAKFATAIAAVSPPLTPSVRQVRLLIPDTDPANRLLRVDQIQDFLDLEGGNVKLAAASAIETIARSEALVSKVIKTQDLSTDGAKVAAELRAHAAELRRQVADADGAEDGGFDIVDYVDPFTRRILE